MLTVALIVLVALVVACVIAYELAVPRAPLDFDFLEDEDDWGAQ